MDGTGHGNQYSLKNDEYILGKRMALFSREAKVRSIKNKHIEYAGIIKESRELTENDRKKNSNKNKKTIATKE